MLKLTINLLVYVALGLALGMKRRKPSPKPIHPRAHVRMMPWAGCLTCPVASEHFYLCSN